MSLNEQKKQFTEKEISMKHQLEVAKTNVVPAAQALTFQNQ
jgi:hypothetical protein